MRKEFSDLINRLFTRNRELGILQLTTQDETLNGRMVTTNGQQQVYFGSCSYLGLETDERLKNASIEAIQKYGTQFSCSRTFLQMGMYDELESLLSTIFGKPTILAPTTSLGHVSLIPVIIGERDAVIADSQVHNSVRNALQMVKGDGVHVETLPHNRMDILETRIQILRQGYDRVWYFADGIYSMYGDTAPVKHLNDLMNKYEQFHVYYDDAHGMSWTGTHGRGYVLQHVDFHPHMMLATSLAKGFGSCGGALVFHEDEQKTFIRNCGSSFIFSGPLQPAILGASIASAKIHLSEEIEQLQNDVFERFVLFTEKAKELNVPVVGLDYTPIFYIATGNENVGKKMFYHLYKQGLFCNHAMFPAVSVKNSGLRISLTRMLKFEDIINLLSETARMLPVFMEQENYTYEELYQAFNIPQERRQVRVVPLGKAV